MGGGGGGGGGVPSYKYIPESEFLTGVLDDEV